MALPVSSRSGRCTLVSMCSENKPRPLHVQACRKCLLRKESPKGNLLTHSRVPPPPQLSFHRGSI